AREAQNNVEQEIFNYLDQALNTYRKDQSLQDFHTALRKALYRATSLQAEADAAEAAQKSANILSESPIGQGEKKDFIQESTSKRVKEEEEKIIRRHTRKTQDAIQIMWANKKKQI